MTTDRERSDQYTNLLLATQAVLNAAERETFLARFPSLKGAQVADILDQMEDADMSLAVIEPMYEAHGHEVPEPHLLSVAAQLCLGLHGTADTVTWEVVQAMIERIRPHLGKTTWELANVQARQMDDDAKAAKLELLAPLGFEDFGDDEYPHGIWHKLIGEFDHRKVSLENVVSVAFHAGKEAGADELRGKLRALLGVPPSNHTHPRDDDGQ